MKRSEAPHPTLRADLSPLSQGEVMILCVLLSGCSILFDPEKALSQSCPASASACPAVPNTTAACEQDTCRYSCASGFADANGDLDAAQGDGCERSCSTGSRPENPATLSALVGETPGEVQWSFPASVSAVARYDFCTAIAGAPEVCAPVTCDAGQCQHITTGHPDNTRVRGQVFSVDVCGQEGSAVSAPTVSATPLDTTSLSAWVLEKSCPLSSASVIAGQLALENPGATCTSSLAAGDELWGDFTLDAVLRFSGVPSDGLLGGLAFHLNGTGHRMTALALPSTASGNELTFLSQRKNNTEKFVAASIIGATAGGLTHLRVVSQGGVISFSMGPDALRLVEVLRWTDTVSRTGKIGIASVGTGRVELTGLRVSTSTALPARGPTSVLIDFADGGFPPTTRPRLPQLLEIVPCPALPQSARCDGGCAPVPGASCAHVNRQFVTLPNFLVDLPAGVDVREPYSLSLRFAVAPDGGGSFPIPVSSTQGALLAANTWFTPTRGLGQDYGVTMEPGAWHDAAWRFDPDAGTFAVSLDDQPVTLPNAAFPPAGWSPHLGAFSFGEGFASEIYVTDVRISQP